MISESLAATSLKMQEIALAGWANSLHFVAAVPSLPRRFKGVNLSRTTLPLGSPVTSGQDRVLSSNPAVKQAAADFLTESLKQLRLKAYMRYRRYLFPIPFPSFGQSRRGRPS